MPNPWSLLSRRRASVRRAPKPASRRLHLELLEDRLAPAAHIGADTYATIQAAVNAANAGAVITVDPGTYAEQVTVNKSVTIKGANSGIPGDFIIRLTESIVTGAAGPAFNITASNVTIDGFTVGDSTNPSNTFGILIAGGVSGTHIQDNVIQDNAGGIGLANNGSGQAVIENNLIRDNNGSGPADGMGIFSNQQIAGGALQNVLIQNNTFYDNKNGSIQLVSTDPTQGISGISIANNASDSGIVLTDTSSSTIHGNSILYKPLGPTVSPTFAILLNGNDNNITITNNELTGFAYGVRIDNAGGIAPSSNILLTDNGITGAGLAGLHIDANGYGGSGVISYLGMLNATGNYWGAATGPTTPANPGGSGTAIDDPNHQVIFAPWLSSGVNNAEMGQTGFYGDEGSLISRNPVSTPSSGVSSGGTSNLLSAMQQLILNDLLKAQQFQGNLSAAQQQWGAWFALAGQQSLTDAVNLVFDEAAVTAGSIMVLQASSLGVPDAALLSIEGALESAISANPLSSTPAGQQLLDLTGALVAARLD